MPSRLLTILAVIVLAIGAYAAWIWTSPEPLGRLPHWVQLRPSIYLDTALRQIETSGFGASSVDWPSVESLAKALAASASSTNETYPAIRYALSQLPDHVSQLVAADDVGPHPGYGLDVLFPERVVAIVDPGSAAEAAGIRPGDVIESVEGHPPMADRDAAVRGALIEIPPPDTTLQVRQPNGQSREVSLATAPFAITPASAHRLTDALGYVAVAGSSAPDNFVEAVQRAVASADAPTVCGWIIDLRISTNGDRTTMLEALRAIVGEPPFGSSVDGSGTKRPWTYPDTVQPVVPLVHPFSPVALLTSRLTAGAAEGVVVAFRGRPGSRMFGEPTRGTPTTTRTSTLADGAVLELTTAFDADRNGTVYRTRIAPDETMPIDWVRFGTSTDPVIVAARTWLQTQPACKH